MPSYAQLHSLSNFSFLQSASHPGELVQHAHDMGYEAIAITDECSLAGVVKAHVAATQSGIRLIIGSSFRLVEGLHLVVLVTDILAYRELSGLISMARRRSAKGRYQLHLRDLDFRLRHSLLIWLADPHHPALLTWGEHLSKRFKGRCWIGVERRLQGGESRDWPLLQELSGRFALPLVACPQIHMHVRERKPLLDVLTAIRYNCRVQDLGCRAPVNAEAVIKSLPVLQHRYSPELLAQTRVIAARCHFSLSELKYEYPAELVPQGYTPSSYLRYLVASGAKRRWPDGVPTKVQATIERELALIDELHYVYYFLTVEDLVRFARSRGILCQGRGSAANSVVCYCLFITEVSPDLINMLFERFISRERNEPPDIDVDFEHSRREEVIQYIYTKYGRRRAALAATVITYRSRSALRDVAKALGIDPLDQQAISAPMLLDLMQQIRGFPRHLSQHVGGFIIASKQISDLAPVENAAMPDRTLIQWDKEDIETLGLLKVDVLALGMLSAIRKSLECVSSYLFKNIGIEDIPKNDSNTYAMLARGDSLGVFQVESRAQMSMLPRLKPACFYDLVIQIAIVRPGPIQGDMVHPYLRRRQGKEQVTYPSDEIRAVLEPTLGIPIFQEQAIRLSMVAAGFSGGEADQLRRAMANWGKNGNLLVFEQKLVAGMLARGYTREYADRLFTQIKGFGGYGFPEAHSASFALLCYVSAWLKCHHPAAFYCALLNSQPMGFYSPSQLVQDAVRHGIQVLPVDVQHSAVEHALVVEEGVSPPRTLRLGLLLVKGLSADCAQRIALARAAGPFISATDLVRRASVGKRDLELLASADALSSLAGHRHQARWDASGVEPMRPLLDSP